MELIVPQNKLSLDGKIGFTIPVWVPSVRALAKAVFEVTRDIPSVICGIQ